MARRKSNIQAGNLEYIQKSAIIKYHSSYPNVKYEDIAKWAQKQFNLDKTPHKSTISRIINNRATFENLSVENHSIHRKLVIKYETLETALTHWVLQKQHQ